MTGLISSDRSDFSISWLAAAARHQVVFLQMLIILTFCAVSLLFWGFLVCLFVFFRLQPKWITHIKINGRTGFFVAVPDLVWISPQDAVSLCTKNVGNIGNIFISITCWYKTALKHLLFYFLFFCFFLYVEPVITILHVRIFITWSVSLYFFCSPHTCGVCKRHPLGVKELLKAYWVCHHAHCVTAVWLNRKPRGCRGYIPSHLWPVPQLTAYICVYAGCAEWAATAVYAQSVYPPL